MFILAICYFTASMLPWFMNLTIQFPMQYCSLQNQTLLPSPATSTTGCFSHFGSASSFFLELFLHCFPVAYFLTIVWSQVKQQGGSAALSFNRKLLLQVLLSMAPSIRTKTSFPHSQSLASGNFHKPLILIHQTKWRPQSPKTDQLITWTTALSNSMKLWSILCRATQDRWVMVESSDKTWSKEKGMASYFSILALRTPWTAENFI